MPPEDEIAAKQEIFVRLLRTTLDLAATLARTAALQAVVDPSAAPGTIDLARLALKSNRGLAGQIRDLTVRMEILARADEIEKLILILTTENVTN
jgi:hypothetical protein